VISHDPDTNNVRSGPGRINAPRFDHRGARGRLRARANEPWGPCFSSPCLHKWPRPFPPSMLAQCQWCDLCGSGERNEAVRGDRLLLQMAVFSRVLK